MLLPTLFLSSYFEYYVVIRVTVVVLKIFTVTSVFCVVHQQRSIALSIENDQISPFESTITQA